MEINKLKDILFTKAKEKGFSDCEIYYSDSSSFKVSVYKGKIEKYQNSQSGGYCFRGLYNGKMGYYFSENVDTADVDLIIANAAANAEILSGEDEEFIFEGSEKYADIKTYDEKLAEMTAEEKINAALEMEKAAAEYDKRITVNSAVVVTCENYIYIANTKGLNLNEKSNCIMALTEVMAEEKGETKEKGELWMGSSISEFNPRGIAERAAEKVISALGGKSVKSGEKQVIIQNETFADIFSCFSSNFYAENIQRGFSLLKDKIDTKIASDKITICDDPLLEGGYITRSFDSEGVATYSKKVVENGVLKTYLYNLKSAAKDNTKSTGNGFKAGFKGTVITSATNFYIEKGDKSFEELAAEVNDGILITDAAGLHSGVNPISGDFSVAAEGFRIEKGKITVPVNQITIAGNFYEILNKIEYVGNDLKFNSSAVGSPSVLISDISVAGL